MISTKRRSRQLHRLLAAATLAAITLPACAPRPAGQVEAVIALPTGPELPLTEPEPAPSTHSKAFVADLLARPGCPRPGSLAVRRPPVADGVAAETAQLAILAADEAVTADSTLLQAAGFDPLGRYVVVARRGADLAHSQRIVEGHLNGTLGETITPNQITGPPLPVIVVEACLDEFEVDEIVRLIREIDPARRVFGYEVHAARGVIEAYIASGAVGRAVADDLAEVLGPLIEVNWNDSVAVPTPRRP